MTTEPKNQEVTLDPAHQFEHERSYEFYTKEPNQQMRKEATKKEGLMKQSF